MSAVFMQNYSLFRFLLANAGSKDDGCSRPGWSKLNLLSRMTPLSKPIVSVIILVALLSCARPGFAESEATVEIDLAVDQGPALHRASGMLWGLWGDEPGDDLIDPLKLQVYRGRVSPFWESRGMASMIRMSAKGARIQAVISDEYFTDERARGMANGVQHYTNPNYDTGSMSGNFSYRGIEIWPGDRIPRHEVEPLLPTDLSDEYIIEQQGIPYIDMTFIWEEIVERVFSQVTAAGIEVEWDFWEEPDWHGWYFPEGVEPSDMRDNWDRYYEFYVRAFHSLRELDPDAFVVGPSPGKYDDDDYNFTKEFLLYAKAHDAVPDSLSWHEIGEWNWRSPEGMYPHHIKRNAEDIRAFMAANDIPIDIIDINELGSNDRQHIASQYAWYLSAIEEARVTSACRAVWHEADGAFNGGNRLGGLLDASLQPRATWWVHKFYADISGTLVGFSEGPTNLSGYSFPSHLPDDWGGDVMLVGMAGVDPADGVLRILIGKIRPENPDIRFPTDDPDFRVVVKNLDTAPWHFNTHGRATVVARHIPNKGWNALPAPTSYPEFTVRAVRNQLTIDLTGLYYDDAVFIELHPDSDGDGLLNKVESGSGTFLDVNDTGSDAFLADSDFDGLPDGKEVRELGLDPNQKDSNGDGVTDLPAYAFDYPNRSFPTFAVTASHCTYEIESTQADDIQFSVDCSTDLDAWYRVAVREPEEIWQKDTAEDATPLFPGIAPITVEATATGVRVRDPSVEGTIFFRTRTKYAE